MAVKKEAMSLEDLKVPKGILNREVPLVMLLRNQNRMIIKRIQGRVKLSLKEKMEHLIRKRKII